MFTVRIRMKLLFPHPVQLRSGEDLPGGAKPDPVRDGPGGVGIVPGDHDHPDPRRVALPDRFGDGRAHRVGEPDEAQELEPEVVLLLREGPTLKMRLGHPKDPQPFLRQGPDFG
jgi:hypothetical protein